MPQAPKESERIIFASFLVMTDEERLKEFGYISQKDFSDAYGISQKTLSHWRNKDPKFKKMKKEMQDDLWDEKLSNVVKATYKRAIEGDTTAQANYMKLVGVMRDKIEVISSADIQNVLLSVIDIIKTHIQEEELLNLISEDLMELAKDL